MIEDHQDTSQKSIYEDPKQIEDENERKIMDSVKVCNNNYPDESIYHNFYQPGMGNADHAFMDQNQLPINCDSATLNITESYYRIYNEFSYCDSNNASTNENGQCNGNEANLIYRSSNTNEDTNQEYLDLTYRSEDSPTQNGKGSFPDDGREHDKENSKTYFTIYNNLSDIYYQGTDPISSQTGNDDGNQLETLEGDSLFQNMNSLNQNLQNNHGDLQINRSDLIQFGVGQEDEYIENNIFTEFNQITNEGLVWSNSNTNCSGNMSQNRNSPNMILMQTQKCQPEQQEYLDEREEQASRGYNENALFGLSTNICLICGDKATGKHYGAQSCDGCKGFFRRSVRKSHQYQCRYSKDCTIDKDKRNQCRFCRLKKCFNVGMKKCAVQNERDKISTRKGVHSSSLDKQMRVEIKELVNADHKARCLYPDFYSTLLNDMKSVINVTKDIFHIPVTISKARDFLLNWLDEIRCFNAIKLEEKKETKKITQKANGASLDLQRSAFNSLANQQIYIDLINMITDLLNGINERLVIPLEELMLDTDEVLAIKALVVFDPNCCQLIRHSRDLISTIRNNLQIELQNYMSEKTYMAEGRFGNSLLLLPNLRDIGVQLQNIVKFFSNFEDDIHIHVGLNFKEPEQQM